MYTGQCAKSGYQPDVRHLLCVNLYTCLLGTITFTALPSLLRPDVQTAHMRQAMLIDLP